MTGLTIYLAIAGAWLLAPVLGLWPPLHRGRAFNSAWSIAMPDPAKHYGSHWKAVYVQELVEWWCSWAAALVAMVPVAWFLSAAFAPQLPWGGTIIALIVAPIAWCWRNTDWGRRQLEYIGWAAEWVQLGRMGLRQGPLRDFAARMSYRVLAETTPEERETALRRRLPLAHALVFILAINIKVTRP